jgi:hypothetical protein
MTTPYFPSLSQKFKITGRISNQIYLSSMQETLFNPRTHTPSSHSLNQKDFFKYPELMKFVILRRKKLITSILKEIFKASQILLPHEGNVTLFQLKSTIVTQFRFNWGFSSILWENFHHFYELFKWLVQQQPRAKAI